MRGADHCRREFILTWITTENTRVFHIRPSVRHGGNIPRVGHVLHAPLHGADALFPTERSQFVDCGCIILSQQFQHGVGGGVVQRLDFKVNRTITHGLKHLLHAHRLARIAAMHFRLDFTTHEVLVGDGRNVGGGTCHGAGG